MFVVCKSLPTKIVFDNIESNYDTLAITSKKEVLWSKFMNIVRYEDLTFRLIMNLCGPKDWIKYAEYESEIPLESALLQIEKLSLLKQVQQNYLLRNFFGVINSLDQIIQLLEPFQKLLLTNNTYKYYTDIYGQDIYNMAYPEHRVANIFIQNGEYIGHIYKMGSDSTGIASFIGIRESLTNTFHKLYSDDGIYGLGYILLSGIQRITKLTSPKIQYLELASPIGPMPKIAIKYGFEYGERMMLNAIPKVQVDNYPITIL